MTDDEIERTTLCVAQMAATLRAGDRAAGIQPPVLPSEVPDYYAARARELFDAARDNVSGAWTGRPRTSTGGGR